MTSTTLPAPATAAPDWAALVGRRTPGHPLEGPFYTSPAVFDLDVAAVLARTWLFVATEAEVREPGDFVTVDVGPYSVIVLRDDDEVVRALHNVCRHRGARVLSERSGSVGNIVCGYHRWTYATDGSLLHAGDQPAGFDTSCFGLKPVHVRVVAGLVFVCLADEPPADFDDVVATVSPYLLPHQLHRTKVAAQVDLVEEANWKLVMENNRECYHCEGGHPELICTFFPTYGYAEDQVPARLRPAHERYLHAEAMLEQACEERGLPYRRSRTSTAGCRPTACSARRWTAPGSPTRWTARAASRRLLGDARRPTARPALAAHAAQRVVPRLRRPRRDLQRAADLGRPDAGADHLAGPRGRGGGRRLRRRDADPRVARDQRAGRRVLRPGPARREQSRLRARALRAERVPGRRVHHLVRRPGARSTSRDDRHRSYSTRPPEWRDDLDDTLVCVAVHDVTHDVRSFVLRPAEPAAYRFQPGQHLTLTVPVDGQPLSRCYTIASSPWRADELTITVKRVPGGPVSGWLHDHLRPGDAVAVDGPLGRFSTAHHPAERYLFLSAGSGITPLMSMLRTIHATGEPVDVVFVHHARTPGRHHLPRRAAGDRVRAPRCPRRRRLRGRQPDERWTGPRGRITCRCSSRPRPTSWTARCSRAAPRRTWRRCGTAGRVGADPERCHEESFDLAKTAAPAATVAGSSGPTYTVELRRSGRTLECDEDTTLLAATAQAGLTLPSSCQEGMCGTCKTTLLSGRVDMQHAGGIRPREIAQDKILLCCSTPREDLVLDA